MTESSTASITNHDSSETRAGRVVRRGRMWKLRYAIQERMATIGETQQALAKTLGCNQGHLSSYIRGARGTSGDNALDLLFDAAEALGLSPAQILGGDGGVSKDSDAHQLNDFSEVLEQARREAPETLVPERRRRAARSWYSPPPDFVCLEIDFHDPTIVSVDQSKYVGKRMRDSVPQPRFNTARAAFEEAWQTGDRAEYSTPFAAPNGKYAWITVVVRRVGDLLLCETYAAPSTVAVARSQLGLVKS